MLRHLSFILTNAVIVVLPALADLPTTARQKPTPFLPPLLRSKGGFKALPPNFCPTLPLLRTRARGGCDNPSAGEPGA